VDGLRAEGYLEVLADPAKIEQYSGLKHADDKNEAFELRNSSLAGLRFRANVPGLETKIEDRVRVIALWQQLRLARGAFHVAGQLPRELFDVSCVFRFL
jgi:hypothetical protein